MRLPKGVKVTGRRIEGESMVLTVTIARWRLLLTGAHLLLSGRVRIRRS